MKDGLKPINILLVEDSPTDTLLAQEAFESSKILNKLTTVPDGVEALKYLHKVGIYKEAPCPDIILLNLNLPKKDGREVLAEIKGDELFRRIPVIVLTTSKNEADILKAYGLHANCYIVKPVDFEKFAEVVRKIEGFWFVLVSLPGGE